MGRSREFLEWSLESTARRLQARFPRSQIMVVKPARWGFGCFVDFYVFIVTCSNRRGKDLAGKRPR